MNSLSHILHTISFMALPLLLAIVLHEYAHGWVANYYGDPTAQKLGRLTVNPLPHIDRMGSILVPLLCLLLPGNFIFGWAKPVPINPTNLRNPQRDMAIVAAAGPAMNLFLAFSSAIILGIIFRYDSSLMAYWPPQPNMELPQDLLGMLLVPVIAMAFFSMLINTLLMLVNLIPIPPLDGGRILISLLPPSLALSLRRVEPFGLLIILGLFFLQPNFIHSILGTTIQWLAMTFLPQEMM